MWSELTLAITYVSRSLKLGQKLYMAAHTIPLDSPLAQEVPIEGGVLGMIVGANTARYVNLAALILLFYDHITTLDKEVERIWTLPWRLPKCLFLMNRYLLSLSFIFGWVVFTVYDATIPLCAALDTGLMPMNLPTS
ncbi:hypothetical protein BD779DRAFT_958989 [Infundibulicybe gibba]|nr:hypothetical protein BD779DRAFT_958989 [Infundibulicybe gibba]